MKIAIALLLLSLSLVVDALNPELKAVFKDFPTADFKDKDWQAAYSKAMD